MKIKDKYLIWIIRLLFLGVCLSIVNLLFYHGTKEPFDIQTAIICGISGMLVAVLAFEYLLIKPLIDAIVKNKIDITRKKFEDDLGLETKPTLPPVKKKRNYNNRKPRNYKSKQNKTN